MKDSASARGVVRFAAAWIVVLSAAGASAAVVSSPTDRGLADAARGLGRGAAMRIENVVLDGAHGPAGLDLVRFDPVAAGARFVVHSSGGPRDVNPALPVYLRGSVDGLRGSVAIVSVHPSGKVRGVVSAADGTWMLERGASAAAGMRSRRIERDALASASAAFECDVLDNPAPARAAASPSRTLRLPIAYTAKVAIELDYDYYATFAPDADAAILYALDMMAFVGTLGESELGMNVEVPYVQLWTTSADPYSGSTGTRRLELRERWNQAGSTNCGGASCTGIARSTVLLLSSATSGGIAYIPGLCDSYHTPTGGYSYAFTGAISGSFDLDNPSAVWDIMATAHELGHNFGSSHTHCYNPPVDECWNAEENCYGGSTSLPAPCPGSGQGCGTIMSYCHQLAGGLGNISLTYGAAHPYGDAPERVPATMASRLATEFASAPACLTPTAGMQELSIETNGSGTGTVTSSPSGIDCSSECRTYFDADTVVTLTPSPSTFSEFAGWSGDADCNDGVVTMSAAVACTATFNGSCGAGNDDCDDGNACTVDSCPGDDHCENAIAPRDPASCFEAGSAKLKITNAADPLKDKLAWQWNAGEGFTQNDLGDPSTSSDYSLCIYDESGGVSSLATSLAIPAGSPHWRNNTPSGWSWSDSDAAYDGMRKLSLKTGIDGKTKVKLTASGNALPLPLPVSLSEFFDQDTVVSVQLVTSDGECWTSSFTSGGTTVNLPTAFRAAGN